MDGSGCCFAAELLVLGQEPACTDAGKERCTQEKPASVEAAWIAPSLRLPAGKPEEDRRLDQISHLIR
jgi:hypothetical protein